MREPLPSLSTKFFPERITAPGRMVRDPNPKFAFREKEVDVKADMRNKAPTVFWAQDPEVGRESTTRVELDKPS